MNAGCPFHAFRFAALRFVARATNLQAVTLGAIVIDELSPRTPTGEGRPKTSVGEATIVGARIFRDGHDILAARVRWRGAGERRWRSTPMVPGADDRWTAPIQFERVGAARFVVEAWTDEYETWRHRVRAVLGAGGDVTTDLHEGAVLLERLAGALSGAERDRVTDAAAGLARSSCSIDVRLNAGTDDAVAALVAGIASGSDLTASPPQDLWVDRQRARFSTWYEFFPRSQGGLVGSLERLEQIAAMGFDVVYVPPIHPIGVTARKGRNNSTTALPGDVGSPWAIGAAAGGHTAIEPSLGTRADFDAFVERIRSLGMELALDYALQCSPDHPWVVEHPEWFHHRPDGTIRCAENPPKRYEDIYPLNFWPADPAHRSALWKACAAVLEHWIAAGVRIFRVDNPHTKPLAFWQWCIRRIQDAHPDVVFLAEAFTRPAMMSKLAEIGFTQSYTYFTWRHTKDELTRYVEELRSEASAAVMRPNFWPNTPDILGGVLRRGPRSAFALRYLLAATLVPNCGIYSGFELCENEPASDANEEYLASEKYEIKSRDWDRADSLAGFITAVNTSRHRHASLQQLRETRFHHVDDADVIAFTRGSRRSGDHVLVVVGLDPHRVVETTLHLDPAELGLAAGAEFSVHDELSGETWTWRGDRHYLRLDPGAGVVGHLIDLNGPR